MNKFCPKCNFMLDIKKNIDFKKLDNIDKIIVSLINENINIDIKVTLNDIKKNLKYKQLSDSNKKILENNYNKYKKLNKTGFYKCLNCGFFKNISTGTVLIDSNKSDLYKGDLYLQLQKNNNILPRTKDYICPNVKCKANDKKFSDREAIFYRLNKTYRLKYMCCICNTEWDIN